MTTDKLYDEINNEERREVESSMNEEEEDEETSRIKIQKNERKETDRLNKLNEIVTTYPILVSSNRFEETLDDLGFDVLCAFSDEQVTSESFISTLKELAQNGTSEDTNLRILILSYENHVYKKVIEYGLYRFFYDRRLEIIKFDNMCYNDKIEALSVDLIILVLVNGIYVIRLDVDELKSIETEE